LLLKWRGYLAQAKNYAEAYDFPIGLLINFGASSLQLKNIESEIQKSASGFSRF